MTFKNSISLSTQTQGELPWKVGAKERVTLWISAYGIKITRNDENFVRILLIVICVLLSKLSS